MLRRDEAYESHWAADGREIQGMMLDIDSAWARATVPRVRAMMLDELNDPSELSAEREWSDDPLVLVDEDLDLDLGIQEWSENDY